MGKQNSCATETLHPGRSLRGTRTLSLEGGYRIAGAIKGWGMGRLIGGAERKPGRMLKRRRVACARGGAQKNNNNG